MEQYIIPAVLILGVLAAAALTRLANWFTWGENRMKKEEKMRRIKERQMTTGKTAEKKNEP